MQSMKQSDWHHGAGKGDAERPVDRSKFRSNFDEIDWSAHRKNIQIASESTETIRPFVYDDDRRA
jgi:hypothetical protein